MGYYYTHTILFHDGSRTRGAKSDRTWRTVKRALAAAERQAANLDRYYRPGELACHSLTVYDHNDKFITNEAA